MSNIPTQIENPNGLHQRYFVAKWINGREKNFGLPLEVRVQAVDKKAEYFVLRLDEYGDDTEHLKACRIAAHAYADAIQHHLPELAKDLKEKYPLYE